MGYPHFGHTNLVFDSHKVKGSSREVGKKENETTYMVGCNTFIDLHSHCLGEDGWIGGQVGRWGRKEDRVHRQVV